MMDKCTFWEKAVLEFRGLVDFVSSDLYRYYGNIRFKTFVGAYFLNRGFNYSFWFRAAQSNVPGLKMIGKWMHRWKSNAYGVHIPLEVKVGYGLHLGHGMPLIINPTAQIGNNCNFSQFLTVGSNHGKAASIGDNVYIGPGVCIVEDVTIGSNCIVGAGAVVVDDVMENSTVVGVPARAVGPNRQPGYVGNRWVSPLERER